MEKNEIDQNNNSSNPNVNEIIKLIIIGSVSVGKTSLLLRYATGKFQNVSKSTSTASYITKIKQANNKTYEIRLWDTAGQEKYRSLAKMFFKDAAVALLVYDITSKSSFIEIKDYWMNLVRENGPKQIIMYLVGNKYDLLDKEAVSEEVAREYAECQNISLWFTSAKKATGIDELFEEIGQKYLSPEFTNSEEIVQRKKRKNEVSKVYKQHSKKNDKSQKKKGCCG